MKLKKNQFILYYNPNKYQEFEVCLVEQDSLEDSDQVEVIKFSRVNHTLRFEPACQDTVDKDRVFMSGIRFQMSSVICNLTGEERCVLSYLFSEITLMNKIEAAIKSIEQSVKDKARRQLKILGKKSPLEISKKLKMSKDGKTKLASKKRVKAPKFRRGKDNPLITGIVARSEQMESDDPRFNRECCIKCNNKELIRAIKTGNRSLFDSILKSSKTISNLRASQGTGSLHDTLTLSMTSESPYYFKRMMTLVYSTKSKAGEQKFLTQAEQSR